MQSYQQHLQPLHNVVYPEAPSAPPGYTYVRTQAQGPPPQNKSTAAVFFGAIQILIALSCIALQTVAILRTISMFFIGSGYWCSLMYLLSGSFGIAAGKTGSRCTIIGHMVLCIMSAVFTTGLLSQAALGLAIPEECENFCNYDYDDDCYVYEKCLSITDWINWPLLALGILEFIIAIIGSGVSCCQVCGTTKVGPWDIPLQVVQTGNTSGQPQQVTQQTTGYPGYPGYPSGQPLHVMHHTTGQPDVSHIITPQAPVTSQVGDIPAQVVQTGSPAQQPEQGAHQALGYPNGQILQVIIQLPSQAKIVTNPAMHPGVSHSTTQQQVEDYPVTVQDM